MAEDTKPTAPPPAEQQPSGNTGNDRPAKRPAADDEEAAMNASSSTSNNQGEKRARWSDKRIQRGKGQKHGGGRDKHSGRQGKWDDKRNAEARLEAKRLRDEEAAQNGLLAPAAAAAEGEDGEAKEKRLPKKRAAVMVGYCGTGYSGMQIQTHGSKTIEGDIFDALHKAGAVSDENFKDHKKVELQRAARTDAGVHAAGNVISLKMILNPPLPEGFATLADYVNSFLPPQIRMWGHVRTMKSFQARTSCDSRVYEYLLPTYCLLPPAKTDALAGVLDGVSPGWRDVVASGAEFVDAAPTFDVTDDTGELDPRQRGEFERRRGYRVDKDTVERFRALIAEYKGTHNFHNYTVGRPFNDRSVKRFMISLEVREPAVYGDIEWLSVRIHGQSFMLHQIRKMIAMAMLACRTGTPPKLLPETFGPKRIHIPKAPPLGLLLEQPQFKTFNERTLRFPKEDGMEREIVDFSPFEGLMHDFKVKWIYEKLREVEFEHNVFHKWNRQVDCTGSEAFSYFNTNGVIPPEAVVTLTSKKYADPRAQAAEGAGAGEGAKPTKAEYESDDEDGEIDAGALARGELDS